MNFTCGDYVNVVKRFLGFVLISIGDRWIYCLTLQPKPLRALSGQVCEICGDEVGLTVDGDLFVACNECGFPVCRPCYEYERREGTQVCPQCKTRYKRLKGKLFCFYFSCVGYYLFTVCLLRNIHIEKKRANVVPLINDVHSKKEVC